jgi:quercetin 2,3-dioxygenase
VRGTADPDGRVEIRRAADRFVSAYDGVVSHHSFSFGPHYDAGNLGFASLVCHNDDLLQPGRGYDDHPHRDLEIVTWVVDGELHHRDSGGTRGVVRAGEVQRMSAGSGVVHAEAAGAGPTRFIQAWVRPDEPGGPPGYEQGAVPATGGWFPVAGGPDALVALGSSTSVLSSCALDGATRSPEAPFLHLFVVGGEVRLETGHLLGAGDAVRLVESGGLMLQGTGLVLAWAMHEPVRPAD